MILSTALTGNIFGLGRQGQYLALKPVTGDLFISAKVTYQLSQGYVNAISKINYYIRKTCCFSLQVKRILSLRHFHLEVFCTMEREAYNQMT